MKVFLTGKGVEAESISTEKFPVSRQIKDLIAAGGKVLACGRCLKIRAMEATDTCPISTMKDMHTLVEESERVLTF